MNFSLTLKESRAARALVGACLRNMGGERPIDLDNDPCTWVEESDLHAAGFSSHEAAGLFGSLAEKGFIEDANLGETDKAHWAVTEDGYRWMETEWDEGRVTYPTIDEAIKIVKRSTGRRFYVAIRGELISEPPVEGGTEYRAYDYGGNVRVRRPDLLSQMGRWAEFAERKGQELRVRLSTYSYCLFVG